MVLNRLPCRNPEPNGLPWESRLLGMLMLRTPAVRKETTMKQMFLVLFLFFAMAAAAQQNSDTFSRDQLALVSAPPANLSEVDSAPADTSPQAPSPAPSQKKPPASALPALEGPPVDASMVG